VLQLANRPTSTALSMTCFGMPPSKAFPTTPGSVGKLLRRSAKPMPAILPPTRKLVASSTDGRSGCSVAASASGWHTDRSRGLNFLYLGARSQRVHRQGSRLLRLSGHVHHPQRGVIEDGVLALEVQCGGGAADRLTGQRVGAGRLDRNRHSPASPAPTSTDAVVKPTKPSVMT